MKITQPNKKKKAYKSLRIFAPPDDNMEDR